MVSLAGAKRKLSGFYQRCIDGMINGSISMQTRITVQNRLDEDMLEDYYNGTDEVKKLMESQYGLPN